MVFTIVQTNLVTNYLRTNSRFNFIFFLSANTMCINYFDTYIFKPLLNCILYEIFLAEQTKPTIKWLRISLYSRNTKQKAVDTKMRNVRALLYFLSMVFDDI